MKLSKLSLVLFIMMLFAMNIYGQNKQMDVPAKGSVFKYLQEEGPKLGLMNLVSSNEKLHVRFWITNHIVDLYIDTNSIYKGFVTFFADEHVRDNEVPTGRIFKDTARLNPVQASQIYSLIQSTNIDQIPTDSVIKGWNYGMDGVTYMFEHEEPTKYSLKTYWTPSIQNVKEGTIIEGFVVKVDITINYKTIDANFMARIPFENYTTGGMSYYTRVLTLDQMRKYRKERDKYRKEHHLKNTE